MNRQRKRLSPSPSLNTVACLVEPSIKSCPQCQYVIHEVLAHEHRWVHIARSVIHNEEAVADFIQEFYVNKLPKKIHSLDIADPNFRLISYIARMVHNFAIDELRRTSRHSILDGPSHIPGLTHDPDERILPQFTNELEIQDLIAYLLRSLSETDAKLLRRILVPGWSISEESINEQVSQSAIRTRVSRLRRRMDRLLNQPYSPA